MIGRGLLLIMILTMTIGACINKSSQANGDADINVNDSVEISDNLLTDEEIADGWMLLFDGHNITHWHEYNEAQPGAGWKAVDGTLTFDPEAKDGGDIITNEVYDNFIFSTDWQISKCGNSGIMFHVQEDEKYEATFMTGPEMQVLDASCREEKGEHDGLRKHRAGDLYDLIECNQITVKPAGEWNTAVIKSDHGHISFSLNGVEVVTFRMDDQNWKDMIANSKFVQWPDFGTNLSGHIALQDHGNMVKYKNIKIRKL